MFLVVVLFCFLEAFFFFFSSKVYRRPKSVCMCMYVCMNACMEVFIYTFEGTKAKVIGSYNLFPSFQSLVCSQISTHQLKMILSSQKEGSCNPESNDEMGVTWIFHQRDLRKILSSDFTLEREGYQITQVIWDLESQLMLITENLEKPAYRCRVIMRGVSGPSTS